MDFCISSTFSVTADVMVVPILFRSSAVAQLSCDSLISVHVPVIVLRSSAMFWRIFSGEFARGFNNILSPRFGYSFMLVYLCSQYVSGAMLVFTQQLKT